MLKSVIATLILLSLLSISGMARACPFSPPSATSEEAKSIFENAVFIGKGRILYSKPRKDRKVIFEIVQSYKGVQKGKIELSGWDNCGRLNIRPGTLYEEIIYKTSKGDYTYAPAPVFSFHSKEIEILRIKAPLSKPLLAEQDACREQSGKWIDHEHFPIRSDCHYPAKDANEICHDNSECEGFCIPDLSKKERDKVSEWNIESFFKSDLPPIEASGKCSEWKNLHGAHTGLVQAGMVTKPYYGELRK